MTFPKRSLRLEVKNTTFIIAGSALIALGVVLFLAPNNIATGGTPGMAILLHQLFSSVSLGALMLCINIPLLLIGMRYLGKSFAVRTILAIALISFFVDLFKIGLKLAPVSDDFLLVTLFGGIVIGVGVALIFRGHSSAGGSTIIAEILSNQFNIKPSHTILGIDALIIASSAFVFKGIEPSLWSLTTIYVTSRCIDMILTGGPSEMIVHIVSDHTDILSAKIIEHLGPNGTLLTGTGLQKNQEKTMIFIVVESRKITILRDIIRNNDPDAFMVVMTASEMLGRGH